jgi:diguanylate cyclase (GGDEF)-like protein
MVASGWLDTDGRTITVTVSIGIALIGQGETAAELLERADTAMYTAKTSGRNRSVLA